MGEGIEDADVCSAPVLEIWGMGNSGVAVGWLMVGRAAVQLRSLESGGPKRAPRALVEPPIHTCTPLLCSVTCARRQAQDITSIAPAKAKIKISEEKGRTWRKFLLDKVHFFLASALLQAPRRLSHPHPSHWTTFWAASTSQSSRPRLILIDSQAREQLGVGEEEDSRTRNPYLKSR